MASNSGIVPKPLIKKKKRSSIILIKISQNKNENAATKCLLKTPENTLVRKSTDVFASSNQREIFCAEGKNIQDKSLPTPPPWIFGTLPDLQRGFQRNEKDEGINRRCNGANKGCYHKF